MEAEARARASNEDGDIKRVSTKEWAKSTGYDPVKLFTKVRITVFITVDQFLLLCFKVVCDLIGLPKWHSGKESACQCSRHRFDPRTGKIPWRRKW